MQEEEGKKNNGKKINFSRADLLGKEPIFFSNARFSFILWQLSAADTNGDYFLGITSEGDDMKALEIPQKLRSVVAKWQSQ